MTIKSLLGKFWRADAVALLPAYTFETPVLGGS
jgi:hypothetical protein